MSIINNPLLLGAPSGGGGGTGGGGINGQISSSLRFNSAASAHLTRTFGTPTSKNIFTLSMWVKRSGLTGAFNLFGSTAADRIGFTSGDSIQVLLSGSGAVLTTAVYRDVSAWYHIVWTLNGTATTVYVNGSSVGTGTGTNGGINTSGLASNIGVATTTGHFSGYLADIHFIDGQALTPTSFGAFDSNNVWQPKAYSGSYGTNGFKLKFSDNSSATALGYDTSGNGNNWTPNNLSVTAGTGNDSLVDSPTNYGTDTGKGGEVRGNYATLNPLAAGTTTLSNGNLDVVTNNAHAHTRATIGVSSGKWYWEVVPTGGTTGESDIGIVNSAASLTNFIGGDANGWGYYATGNKYNGSGAVSYAASYTTNDVIGVALDADAGTLTFYKNGVSQGQAFSGLTSGPYFPAVSDGSSAQSTNFTANFGQRPFAYTAPSGYKALCSTNLPEPTILNGATAMDVVTYTGTGTSLTPTSSLRFSPDLVWIKGRSGATDNTLYDIVRGAQARLESNTTDAEVTTDGGLTAFNSNGFTLGTLAQVNTNTATYAAWCWDAGSSTVTNTAGTISSQVRANPSAGFSVVTFTAQSSGTGTVGHGLGAAPSMFIMKTRGTALDWPVYTASGGAGVLLALNSTIAFAPGAAYWNSTAPTSTVFTVGSYWAASGNYVAYCFAPVSGYSAFGSYTGNGSADGPFVYTGFRPRWILIKQTTAGSNTSWFLFDSARVGYNSANNWLNPDTTASEGDGGGAIDILSNGFKLRASLSFLNISNGTYIYAAFAEHPFALARAR